MTICGLVAGAEIGTWVIVKMKLTVLTADERIVSLDVEPDELVSLPSNPSSFFSFGVFWVGKQY